MAWVWVQPREVGRGPWTVTLPGGPLTLLQIGIGIVDLGFCALAMYVLTPDEPNLGFVVVAVIFVSATLLGFASHSPGGLGVFDAAMLVGLWQMDREDLLAGMLLFRVLYYIAPFVISVILLTFREVIIGTRSKRLQRLAHGRAKTGSNRGMRPSMSASEETAAPDLGRDEYCFGALSDEAHDGDRRYPLFLLLCAVAGPVAAFGHHPACRGSCVFRAGRRSANCRWSRAVAAFVLHRGRSSGAVAAA